MFVPEDRLKINLPPLIEKAISKWSETQPLGFTRPLVQECWDFIASEMDARGLRRLQDGEPWFSDKATAQEFRECVFTALDHWLVKAEISGEPVREERYVPTADPPPFSAAGMPEMPPVDPYCAFNESWGPPAETRSDPVANEVMEIPFVDARPRRHLTAWLHVALVNLLGNRREIGIALYAVMLVLLFLWLFRFIGCFH